MRTLDQLVELAGPDVRLRVDGLAIARASESAVDSLFHVPLLALTVLAVAAGRKEGVLIADLAAWTLATLTKHFESRHLSSSSLRWSVLLRRRCADALVFLEQVGMVAVQQEPARVVRISLGGLDFLRKAGGRADEVGVLTRQLRKSYEAVNRTGLELL
jgi:hypothetical protein